MGRNGLNDNEYRGGKWTSWPAIALMCLFFWPVGLLLLWKRISVDKRAGLNIGKTITICGWTGFVLAILRIIIIPSEGATESDIGAIVFFILGGIALILLGKYIKDNSKKMKKYIAVVANQGITDINKIAEIIPTTYEIALKDLNKMIDKGYFEGSYIDENAKKILLPKRHHEDIYSDINSATEETKMVSKVCKSCGANNTITVGTVEECEFCGSPIEA